MPLLCQTNTDNCIYILEARQTWYSVRMCCYKWNLLWLVDLFAIQVTSISFLAQLLVFLGISTYYSFLLHRLPCYYSPFFLNSQSTWHYSIEFPLPLGDIPWSSPAPAPSWPGGSEGCLQPSSIPGLPLKSLDGTFRLGPRNTGSHICLLCSNTQFQNA